VPKVSSSSKCLKLKTEIFFRKGAKGAKKSKAILTTNNANYANKDKAKIFATENTGGHREMQEMMEDR
jgi:hypothetical protein